MTKKKEDVSTLADLSVLIQRMDDERIARENERIEAMQKALPTFIVNLPNQSVDDLLSLYCRSQSYYMSEREANLWLQVGDAVKTEIKRRIDKSCNQASNGDE